MLCRDPACQDAGYAGLIAAFEGEAFFAGVYFHGWTSDPTAGGPSDMSYTPRGKPAEKTVSAWFANRNDRSDGTAGARPLPSIADELTALTKDHVVRHRSDAAAIVPADRRTAGVPPPPPKDYLNGFVFGMGEWSHPDTTLDDAKRSLADTADVGANAVEFTPWGSHFIIFCPSLCPSHHFSPSRA